MPSFLGRANLGTPLAGWLGGCGERVRPAGKVPGGGDPAG